MVPANGAIELDHILLLVVQIDGGHLRGIESLASATSAPTATAGEAHVVDVVGTDESHSPEVVLHQGTHAPARIAILGACAQVDVREHASVHAPLQAEVEHGLVLAVVNTRDAAQVALLVVGLDAFYDTRRQILDSSLGVARHELLTIDHHLLHLLAVDGNGAVVANLGSGQALHQLLDDRPLGRAIRTRIIYDGIVLGRHPGDVLHHLGSLQHDGIGGDSHGTQGHRLAATDGDATGERLKAHIRNTHDVSSI